MAVKEIIRMGNPILRNKNLKITQAEVKSKEFGQLIRDMYDTMMALGGIGIAAPQIGINKQLAMIELGPQNRYQEKDHSVQGLESSDPALYVFINPEISVLDQKTQGFWEGCLSVPGLRGRVERPRSVKVTYMDQTFKKQEIIFDDFLATVIQHELDHLNGILYVDKIKDLKELAYEEEFLQFHQDPE